MNEHLSVSEVAKKLKISRQAVLKRINAGTLKAQKVGNIYVIKAKDLK